MMLDQNRVQACRRANPLAACQSEGTARLSILRSALRFFTLKQIDEQLDALTDDLKMQTMVPDVMLWHRSKVDRALFEHHVNSLLDNANDYNIGGSSVTPLAQPAISAHLIFPNFMLETLCLIV